MLHKFFRYLFNHQVLLSLFLLALGWFLFEIRDIIISLFLSYIIMAALLPLVEYLQKKKFPKVLAVIIPYFGVVILLFLLIIPLVPFVVTQIQQLIYGLPKFINRATDIVGFANQQQIELYVKSELNDLSKNVLSVTGQVFGGFFSVLTTFIVSFYLLMYHEVFEKFVSRLFAPELRPSVIATIDRVNDKLGSWLRGELMLMTFIGSLTWIVLTLMHIPYALPLAVLAGLLEIIPTIGPIISAVPAVIVGLSISPTLAFAAVIGYILIQAIENNFLVPIIMQNAVGLNPIIVILAIVIGSKLMGIAGALLAIPFVSFLLVVFQNIEVIRPENHSSTKHT